MAIIAAHPRRIKRSPGLGGLARGRLTPYTPPPQIVRKQPVAQPAARPTPRVPAGLPSPIVAPTPVAAPVLTPKVTPARLRPRVPSGLQGIAPSPWEAPRPAPGGLTGLNRFRGTAGPVSPEIFKLAQRRSTGVPGNTHYASKLLSQKELK
jgi:hypothetical protein